MVSTSHELFVAARLTSVGSDESGSGLDLSALGVSGSGHDSTGEEESGDGEDGLELHFDGFGI